MVRTHTKAAAVLAAAGTVAQDFLPGLSQQAAAWIPAPTTTGPPFIGGPATPGDGAEPYGTTIISWSTQHFTVTTGFPDGFQNGTITDTDGGGSIMTPTAAAASQDVSQVSEPEEVFSGGVLGGLPGDPGPLQTESVADGEGGVPLIATGSLGPSEAPVSGAAVTSGAVTAGLPGDPGPPQTGPIDDGGGNVPLIATDGLVPTETSEAGAANTGTVAPGNPGAGPPADEPATHGGSVPPTAAGNPESPPASVPESTPPSESAPPPPPEVFVIQLGPVGAAAAGAAPAAIESGAAGPRLGRRQDENDNKNDQYLMNAGRERSGDCAQATRFEIVDGELTRGGLKVSTGQGVTSAQRLAVSPAGAVGSITRSWEIVGGELLWLNESFVGGRARFCVDERDRVVFFTTMGEGGVPAGCTPEKLTPMFVADCPGLNNPGGDLLPAEETLILPPGVYFPGREPKGQACRVTTEFWTVGQSTVAPAPTGLSRRLW